MPSGARGAGFPAHSSAFIDFDDRTERRRIEIVGELGTMAGSPRCRHHRRTESN